MPDASPVKWHLAHTTWFFETFLLERWEADFRPFHPDFRVLFNSYYETVGDQHPRPRRGLLTRPSLDEVRAYRAAVDERIAGVLRERADNEALHSLLTVGLHHEQQHQELILTDVKHLLAANPLLPAYTPAAPRPATQATAVSWLEPDHGLVTVGHPSDEFAFDNERPAHEVFLRPFAIRSRPVTNAEYIDFIDDRGYTRPELWLSDGWATVQQRAWDAPSYWSETGGNRRQFTLGGLRDLEPDAPVCHVSYYEADAFARWADARLPTEAEWEVAARHSPLDGNFVETEHFHPVADDGTSTSFFGNVWEWTSSPYAPYPGYRAPDGALGEYNGKFMCNQMVLRGGSCATPQSHIRATYRNFFYPDTRWQFSGVRLARDL